MEKSPVNLRANLKNAVYSMLLLGLRQFLREFSYVRVRFRGLYSSTLKPRYEVTEQ